MGERAERRTRDRPPAVPGALMRAGPPARSALPAAIGNHAFTRAVLQRAVYRWDAESRQWIVADDRGSSSRSRPPDKDGAFDGQIYDDSTYQYSPPKRRIEEEAEAEGEERPQRKQRIDDEQDIVVEEGAEGAEPLPEDITEWLATEPTTESEYDRDVLPRIVRRISKGGADAKQLSCWSWALQGLAPGTFHRDTVWGWLTQEDKRLFGRDHPAPPWVTALPDAVQDELRRVMTTIAEQKLLVRPKAKRNLAGWQTQVTELMESAVRAIVTGNGFTIVDDEPAAWIVCHYKLAEGMAVPEHWWIELPGPQGRIVLQTVPGVDIEIGGEDLRWHSATSAEGRDFEAEEYREVHVGVAALAGPHLALLRASMDAERQRRARAASAQRGRGRGRGRGARGRGRGVRL
jgi:hypothetical protein